MQILVDKSEEENHNHEVGDHTAAYDFIAEEYAESKNLHFRQAVESFSLFELTGSVEGKHVLDLACGEGHYTRKLKQAGAASIVGIDISHEMIELARRQELDKPLGCQYAQADVANYNAATQVELIVAMYLLNYARDAIELQDFCNAVYNSLAAKGQFVGVNDNIHVHPALCSYRKYGFTKETAVGWREGQSIHYTIYLPDGSNFHFDNYYLSPDTYEKCFSEAGFNSFEWIDALLDPQAKDNNHWDDFMTHPPIIAFRATKERL